MIIDDQSKKAKKESVSYLEVDENSEQQTNNQ